MGPKSDLWCLTLSLTICPRPNQNTLSEDLTRFRSFCLLYKPMSVENANFAKRGFGLNITFLCDKAHLVYVLASLCDDVWVRCAFGNVNSVAFVIWYISKYCQNFMLIWKYEDIKYARFHKIKSPCSLFLHLLHHIRCKQFPLPWMDNGAVNSSNLIFWNSQIGWICKIVLIMQICWCWFFKFREPTKYYLADFFR